MPDNLDKITAHWIKKEFTSSRIDRGEDGCALLTKRRETEFLTTDDLRALPELQDVVGVSYNEAKKIANNLIHKRWLDRLTSETYLIVPLAAGGTGEYTEHEFVIASHLAEPMDRILECVQRRWLD